MTWVLDRVLAGVTNSDYVLDYSAGFISGHAIASAGYSGCKRYIDDISNPDLVRRKHTNRAEYQDHLANGLHDTLIMEVGTGDPLGGFNGGREKALRAAKGAELIGYQGKTIAFCCDRWFVTKDEPTITRQMWQDYLGGAASIVGSSAVEAYGFSDAMDAAQGLAGSYWQAGSKTVVRDFVDSWQDNNWAGSLEGVGLDRNLVRVIEGFDMTSVQDEVYTAVTNLAIDAASGNPDAKMALAFRSAIRSILSIDQLTDDEVRIIAEIQRSAAVVTPEQLAELKAAVKEAQTDEEAEAVVNAIYRRLTPPDSTAPSPGSEV